ncbi:hypothetical protein PFISCL1PPCAC_8454, partial [Pristionchus fissidentatus]
EHDPTMLSFIVVSTLVTVSLGCAPSSGDPSKNFVTATPKLSFAYSPPLIWTYNTNGTVAPGQAFDEAQAQAHINQDIEFAIIKALQQYGYSSSGISIDNAIVPADVTVGTCEGGAPFEADGDSVAFMCAGAEKQENRIEGAITVKSPVPLSGSQWESIALRIYSSLIATAGVRFYDLIEVSEK